MKIDSVIFATGNPDKLREARNILGLKIEGTSLNIDEIQSLDPDEVSIKKAESYFKSLKKPLFVEDVSLSIESLGGLPGTYIDAFMKSLGNEGILKLLEGKTNRKAIARATLVYKKGSGYKIFRGLVKGKVSLKVKGEGFGWDPIFIPEGSSKTFAEMNLDEKNEYSMRKRALSLFKVWLHSTN